MKIINSIPFAIGGLVVGIIGDLIGVYEELGIESHIIPVLIITFLFWVGGIILVNGENKK